MHGLDYWPFAISLAWIKVNSMHRCIMRIFGFLGWWRGDVLRPFLFRSHKQTGNSLELCVNSDCGFLLAIFRVVSGMSRKRFYRLSEIRNSISGIFFGNHDISCIGKNHSILINCIN